MAEQLTRPTTERTPGNFDDVGPAADYERQQKVTWWRHQLGSLRGAVSTSDMMLRDLEPRRTMAQSAWLKVEEERAVLMRDREAHKRHLVAALEQARTEGVPIDLSEFELKEPNQ